MSRHGGGDDLDDDFVPDDLVALESDEDVPETEDINELLSADEDASAGPSQPPSAAALEKKRKRRAKEKERKAKVRPPQKSLAGPVRAF